jgi:hypothetical protein
MILKLLSILNLLIKNQKHLILLIKMLNNKKINLQVKDHQSPSMINFQSAKNKWYFNKVKKYSVIK